MSEKQSYSCAELSNIINEEAKGNFNNHLKAVGSGVLALLPVGLNLRMWTKYPYRFTEDTDLFPRTDSSFGRVVQKSRADGLREIHRALGRQDEEHAWTFLPGSSLWLDLTVDAGLNHVRSDTFAQIFLSHHFGTTESVHTHPGKFPTSGRNLLENALPSDADITAYATMSGLIPETTMGTSSIVSHYGVTSFSMTHASPREGGAFQNIDYDWHIAEDAPDPAMAIRAALGRMAQHELLDNGEPTLQFAFEPLV